MRLQQQNRRLRGRNNSNRKPLNPLTRNYESSGPDMRIRGSAQQIAEKYTSLARDTQSAGDRVMSESYWQHAEHYNRIIAAAQAHASSYNQEVRKAESSEGRLDSASSSEIPLAGMSAPDSFHGPKEQASQADGHSPRQARRYNNRDQEEYESLEDQASLDLDPAGEYHDDALASSGSATVLPHFITEEASRFSPNDQAAQRAHRPNRVRRSVKRQLPDDRSL